MSNPAFPARVSSNIADDGAQRPVIGDEKLEAAQCVEDVPTGQYVSPLEIQARFSTLRHLNEEQMDTLNKKVRRIIDWRMMPAVTLMFLMK
jgi:hypothetical protein